MTKDIIIRKDSKNKRGEIINMYDDINIYRIYEQEDIDDIYKNSENGTIKITNENNIKICNVNNLYGKGLHIEDVERLRIINCDLNPYEYIYINKNIEGCTIEDSTINIMKISNNFLKFLELKNCYVKRLDIDGSQEIGTIYFYNSIIDKLDIEHSTIMNGFIINNDNRIKNLYIAYSFIVNLYKNSYNEIMRTNINSVEDIAIDDYDLIDLIENSVEVKNACIIEKDDDERYNFIREDAKNEKD